LDVHTQFINYKETKKKMRYTHINNNIRCLWTCRNSTLILWCEENH